MYRYDAEGSHDGEQCPRCGSEATITYHFAEGFTELECPECGYVSDSEQLADLQRFGGEILESEDGAGTPVAGTLKKIRA